jgi:hypothetical protein
MQEYKQLYQRAEERVGQLEEKQAFYESNIEAFNLTLCQVFTFFCMGGMDRGDNTTIMTIFG